MRVYKHALGWYFKKILKKEIWRIKVSGLVITDHPLVTAKEFIRLESEATHCYYGRRKGTCE